MKQRILLILLFLIVFVIYLLTSAGNTPYDYFIRLADAFLNNSYYLTDNPAWLNELIPLKNGGYGVVYPPAPAIIAMPFVYLYGPEFPQQIIAHLLGALLIIITAKIAYLKSKRISMFIWVFLLAGFGNIIWYLSSNGSVWYLGQVAGAFFLMATLYESLTKKRPIVVSVLFAMAVLSRLQLVLAFPIISYLNKDSLTKLKVAKYLMPFGVLMSLFCFYNFLRFGSFFETGYSLIPNVLNEPWYYNGIFSTSYITNNLRVMFTSLPIIFNEFPYIRPSWGGLSILITSPAFIYAIFAKLKDKENIYIWLSLLMVAFVNLSHGGTGFTQFGYRYAVDFYPLIFMLVINHLKVTRLKWHHYLLLTFSIIVNLWGVLWINKFGWVSF